MAQYEITNFVDPKVLTDLKSLNDGVINSTASLMKLLELQKGLKTQLDDTAASTSSTAEKSEKYAKVVNEAAKGQQQLSSTQKELISQQNQLNATEAKLATANSATNKALIEKRIKLQDVNKAMKDKIKTSGAEEGSLIKMRQRLKELTEAYDNSGKRTKASANEINKLSKEIQAAEGATNRHQRNVGNYGSAFNGLLAPIKTAGAALKSFLANPVIAIVAGIVAAFALLTKAMKRNEEGQEKLNQVMAFLRSGLNVFLDIITNVANALFDAFQNPKQAINDLWETLKTNLINRVTAIPDLFKGIFETVVATFSFLGNKIKIILADIPIIGKNIDAEESKLKVEEALESMKDSAIKTGQAFVQMNTGITPEGFEKIGDAIKNVVNEVNEETKAGAALQKRRDALRKQEREFIVEKERMRTTIALAREAMQDESIEVSERLRLNKEAIDTTQKLADIEIGFAKEKAAILQAEVNMGASTQEQLEELERIKADIFINEQERSRTTKRLLGEGRALENRINKESITENTTKNKEDEAAVKAAAQFTIQQLELKYRREVNIIKVTSATKEEAAKRIAELDEKNLRSAISSLNIQLDTVKDGSEEWYKIKADLAKAEQDLDDAKTDKIIENIEKQTEAETEAAEKKKKVQEASFDLAMQVQDSLFSFMDAKYSGDLERLQQSKDAGLISEQEFATKKAEIEIKQAKASRAQGVFNVAISTAQAIMGIWRDFPKVDFGITAAIMTGVVAGIGGLQAAAILSAPLPQMPAFAKGTDNAPRRGIFGEAGAELMMTTQGEVYYADKATYFDGNQFKGATIKTSAETAEIMSRTKTPVFGGQSRSDNAMLLEIKGLRKDLKRQKNPIFGNDNKAIGYTQDGSTTKIVNYYKYGR